MANGEYTGVHNFVTVSEHLKGCIFSVGSTTYVYTSWLSLHTANAHPKFCVHEVCSGTYVTSMASYAVCLVKLHVH